MLPTEEILALATPTPEIEELLSANPPHVGGWTMDTDIDLLRDITAQISAAQRAKAPDPLTLPFIEEDDFISTRDGSTIKIRIHKPRNIPEDGCPVLVAFHGGGFVIGTVDNSTSFCRLFTSLGGVAVNVEYRLSPEHPFPTPVNDCFDAVKWTVEHAKNLGVNLGKGFLVGGESAGADLAQGVAYLYGKEELAPPLTGVYSSISSAATEETIPEKYRDHFLSLEQNSHAPVITKESLQLIKAKYKPDPTSPVAYPIVCPDLGRYMPKTYFQACGMDPLRDCTLIMNEVWKEAGIATKMDIYPGLPHGFWIILPTADASKKFLDDCKAGFQWLLTVN